MKRVRIHHNEIGLVIKHQSVVRVLTAGHHWLGWSEKCEIHDLAKPLQTLYNKEVLLHVPGFIEQVHVVDVADKEICLVFVNGNLHQVLAAGRYLFWKGVIEYRFQIEDISSIEIASTVDRMLLDKLALAPYVRQYHLEPSEKGLLFIEGALLKVLDAGTYFWWKNNKSISVAKADMRVQTLEIVGQEILTKDKAQLRINYSLQYEIIDILKALLSNKDYEKQLYVIMQLALRSFIGRMTFDELMENKSTIGTNILEEFSTQLESLGVRVMAAGLKDVILPGDMREIMNQVLIAEKRAQANIIMRREETASTRSLLNTAKLMEDNGMLYKLKEMEYVEKIAEKINNISVSGNGQIVDQLKQLFVK